MTKESLRDSVAQLKPSDKRAYFDVVRVKFRKRLTDQHYKALDKLCHFRAVPRPGDKDYDLVRPRTKALTFAHQMGCKLLKIECALDLVFATEAMVSAANQIMRENWILKNH